MWLGQNEINVENLLRFVDENVGDYSEQLALFSDVGTLVDPTGDGFVRYEKARFSLASPVLIFCDKSEVGLFNIYGYDKFSNVNEFLSLLDSYLGIMDGVKLRLAAFTAEYAGSTDFQGHIHIETDDYNDNAFYIWSDSMEVVNPQVSVKSFLPGILGT